MTQRNHVALKGNKASITGPVGLISRKTKIRGHSSVRHVTANTVTLIANVCFQVLIQAVKSYQSGNR